MGLTIEHFIWSFQPHFRVNQECNAKAVFQILDEHFEPQVFLVGILVDQSQNSHPACVEPEHGFWAQSKTFNETLERARDISESYPEHRIHQSHPQAQEAQDERLFLRSVRDAVSQVIAQNPDNPNDFSYFVSMPTRVNRYLVHVVLGLQTSVLERYPRLRKNSLPLHEFRSFSMSTSLTDAVIKAYLERAEDELHRPDPGAESGGINADEIVRGGANRFMLDLGYRVNPTAEYIEGWHRLLDLCDGVSRTHYERAEAHGVVILARKDHCSLEKVVCFTEPPKLWDKRAARKLLQLSSEDAPVHMDSQHMYGLIRVGKYMGADEDLFKIRFCGLHYWEVLHEEEALMAVRYGRPCLPKPSFDEGKLRCGLRRTFAMISDEDAKLVISLIRAAEKEKHGTTLVLTNEAESESKRLSGQGFAVHPRQMDPEIMRRLTPIDGAILLDPKGTCYAIGTILDGKAVNGGNSARGARFNSAIRYVEGVKPSACLAVIVSEDGGIDFYPDLQKETAQVRE